MSSGKRVHLYGDESHFQGTVTYGFVIIPTAYQQKIEDELVKAKQRHGLKSSDEIHCRALFQRHAKEKSSLRHLSKAEIFTLLNDLTRTAYCAGARGWVGYLHTNRVPDSLLFETLDPRKRQVDTWDISDLKVKMLFAYEAAIAPLTHFITPEDVGCFVDGDTSKVSHMNGTRRQVDQLRSFFPVEHNDRKFNPIPLRKPKPIFLELADVLAYSSAHGLSNTITTDKSQFVSAVNNLKPGYSEAIFNIPNGGPFMSARAYDPQDGVKNYLKSYLDREG